MKARQLPQLVAGKLRRSTITIAFTQRHCRRRQSFDRFEQRRGQSPRPHERQQHRANHRDNQHPLRRGGEFFIPGRRVLHRHPVAAPECFHRGEHPHVGDGIVSLIRPRPQPLPSEKQPGSARQILAMPGQSPPRVRRAVNRRSCGLAPSIPEKMLHVRYQKLSASNEITARRIPHSVIH